MFEFGSINELKYNIKYKLKNFVMYLVFPPKYLYPNIKTKKKVKKWKWIYLIFLIGTIIGFPYLIPTFPIYHIVLPLFIILKNYNINLFSILGGDYTQAITITLFSLGLYTGTRFYLNTRWYQRLDLDSFRIPFIKDYILFKKYSVVDISKGSIVINGDSGSGKSNTIKLLCSQITLGEDTPLVCFDPNSEYRKELTTLINTHRKQNVGSVTLGPNTSQVSWNLFREIKEKEDFDRIAHAITHKQGNEEYWNKAVRQVLRSILILIQREAERANKTPTNKDLIRFLELDYKEAYEKLSQYSDLGSGHIDPDSEKQAQGVWESVKTKKDLFIGSFREKGTFSIRRYMQDPRGRILFLDMPMEDRERIAPLYRLFSELAIIESFNDRGKCVFLYDEFPTVPRSSLIERVINEGRKFNNIGIFAFQSVNQVFEKYGRETAKTMISGPNQILFHPHSSEDTRYIQNQIGKERTKKETTTISRGQYGERHRTKNYREEREYPLSQSELNNLPTGKCVVIDRNSWYSGKLPMYEDVAELLKEEVGRIQK